MGIARYVYDKERTNIQVKTLTGHRSALRDAASVRVIDPAGAASVMSVAAALAAAAAQGLDLVEVSPKAVPPVCKIMDFGKYKYDQSKQEARARRNQTVVVVKEMKFRPKTDDHDFDFKVKHIREFIAEGNKVKLVVSFKGREIVHPEAGRAMLQAVMAAVGDVAVAEQSPSMEGKKMLMMLGPKPKGSK